MRRQKAASCFGHRKNSRSAPRQHRLLQPENDPLASSHSSYELEEVPSFAAISVKRLRDERQREDAFIIRQPSEWPEMLDWFRALMPKEDRFFGLFERHAALVVAGAESLRAALQGGPEERRQSPERVRAGERRRRSDARGAPRGPALLHHALRPRRHHRPHHRARRLDRPDAEDHQGHPSCSRSRASSPR